MRVFALFGRPRVLQALHGWFTVFWVVLWAAATATDLVAQVRYVSHLSQAALVLGSWSAWQAARVETKQQAQIDSQEEP